MQINVTTLAASGSRAASLAGSVGASQGTGTVEAAEALGVEVANALLAQGARALIDAA